MENEKKLDFLIVGQGLAGSLLSYFLLKENKKILVVDYPHQGRTSSIAAGLINPVTGRRIAKSWRFEELMPFARQTYQDLEKELSVELWHERKIARALHNVFEENEWLRRSAFPEFAEYLDSEPDLSEIKDKLHQPYAWGELKNAAQVSLPLLLEAWQEKLKAAGQFILENINYKELKLEVDSVLYKDWTASKLVFCEGSMATHNPYFNHLPFLVTKGELLLVKIPGYQTDWIIKHPIFLIPLHDDLFWVGATSRYEFDDVWPSPQGRDWLVAELDQTIGVPYQIVEHKAGIRPTVADVRPLLGLHPHHPQLALFNGLGTKGALMGPFFAKQMAGYLLGKRELDVEVDIRRFQNGSVKGHNFKRVED